MGFANNDVALGRALPRLFDQPRRSGGLAISTSVEVLRGQQAVAARRDLLVELCRRTGQAGAMDALEVSLDKPTSRAKIPYLVLVGSPDTMDWDTVTADDLDGAVLIYEYKIAGRGTGVFATDNVNGEGTVIAQNYLRTDVAEAACQTLLNRGALTVMITLEGKTEARGTLGSREELTPPGRMGTRTREVPRYLLLGDTLDATLAMLGRHTRRNLRYYRRRLETEVGAVFVPSVAMERAEFLEFNRTSMYPASEAIAAWRYDAIQRTPNSLFAGVRARDGRWLSLIGGRRHSPVTEIDWQMNLAGLPRYSLSTVMRSYILEHEIELGIREIVFIGGTPHSMRHSFVCRDAVDVIVQRRSVNAWLLRLLSRWIFPEKNFLGQALRDKDMRWTNW